jgi:hypothetical protein
MIPDFRGGSQENKKRHNSSYVQTQLSKATHASIKRHHKDLSSPGQAQVFQRRGQRIAPKVLLPGEGAKMVKKDTLCQKSGYRGRNG